MSQQPGRLLPYAIHPARALTQRYLGYPSTTVACACLSGQKSSVVARMCISGRAEVFFSLSFKISPSLFPLSILASARQPESAMEYYAKTCPGRRMVQAVFIFLFLL